QCDKCEAWQHQICALYNSKQDLEGKSYYICPSCRLFELEAKGHTSMPPALGANDLPRTKLSDHIEQRLFKNLEKERKQRAELLGKPPEE
ncbi:Histone acetyltransferase HAC1, partial [Striga hermonthica]